MNYITAGDNPRLRYPNMQPEGAHPSRFEPRAPYEYDDSDDDDDGDYEYEYYRPRQEYD